MWSGDIPSTSFPVNAKNNWLDQAPLRARPVLKTDALICPTFDVFRFNKVIVLVRKKLCN